MTVPLRHLLADDDLTADEQSRVLDLAARLKVDPFAVDVLRGPRSVALVFDKPTLRTQASFMAGVHELQGAPMVVDGRLAGIGERESVADVARVLGRQVSTIVWRTFAQSDLRLMAEHAGVPVVNALTDDFHPCQLLADLLTIREHKGRLAGLRVAYIGDGANNMAHSTLLAGALAGMHVQVVTPSGYLPAPGVVARAEALAAGSGGSVQVADDPAVLAGADVLVTDTWVSMGTEDESAEREAAFAGYRLTSALAGTAPEAVVLHCLPAYRGKEIDAEVLDGPRSVVWDQAENRRHAQKAVLALLAVGFGELAGERA
ncbi:ornithine carbamoyltransferase [Auraticoccus monumenti]|uniref:Ornithine carbamoyltransferase n=1 Tax=Auraticoccus monumenti TaxID=675864 RepID=A0A1G7CWV2_9ACTN|nr:ornithine carbamoyltransferase [Auraticoccus monumenti]SDE43767.1 ornithine carbamoyltransferase [Auraticoccus monumenti]